MRIASLPQESQLSPLFPAPAHLTRPEFIGNAVIHDGYNGDTASVSLYQCNAQGAHGVTKVIAVTEFGTSFVFRFRKMFDINAFVADDISKQSNVISVIFRSEWL